MPNLSARSVRESHCGLAGAAAVAAMAACLALVGCSATVTYGAGGRPSATVAGPFTGTPAEGWADGAAGIVLPAAEPVGGFTAAQVELAYTWTRRLLVAGFLNKPTLLGGAPTAFEQQLPRFEYTYFLENLHVPGMDKSGRPQSSRSMIMSFRPGTAQLIGSVIKVHGTMQAKADKQNGNFLDIDFDYDFVYPVERPNQPDSAVRVVDQVAWTLVFGDWAGEATAFEPGIRGTDESSISGVLCETTDGYYDPAYPAQDAAASTTVTPSGKPVDPYALGGKTAAGCTAVTGP